VVVQDCGRRRPALIHLRLIRADSGSVLHFLLSSSNFSAGCQR
jgi:hypothetical protein